jgi:RepB DNA-primase from phage plasmid
MTPQKMAPKGESHTDANSATEDNPSVIGLEPDLGPARQFLDLLEPNGLFTFLTLPEKDPSRRSELTRVFHGDRNEHLEALASLNQQGAGIFVMVNAGDGIVHPGTKSCRTNANVRRVRALYIDLNGAALEPVLESGLHPHIVVNSSPGRWHAYWRVSDCPLEDFGPLQKQLIAKFEADKIIHDLSRVMRLPGFIHQKGDPFITTICFPKEHTQ